MFFVAPVPSRALVEVSVFAAYSVVGTTGSNYVGYLSCDIVGSVKGRCFPGPVCRPLFVCCWWPRVLLGVAAVVAYSAVDLRLVRLCWVPLVRLLACAGSYLSCDVVGLVEVVTLRVQFGSYFWCAVGG